MVRNTRPATVESLNMLNGNTEKAGKFPGLVFS